MEILTGKLIHDSAELDDKLGTKRSYDVVGRDIAVGGKNARLYFIDGYADSGIMQRIIAVWQKIEPIEIAKDRTMESFLQKNVPFGEAGAENDIEKIVKGVLLGKTLLLIDGFKYGALLDAKEYPSRGIEEPQDGKVLRGAHDGFVEAVKKNTAMIRRRIRDGELTCEVHSVGVRSKSDIVLCYLRDKTDEKLLDELRNKINKIDVNSISMGQESVAEAMIGRQWYNPLPRVRYTERPDTAAACIMEGGIILLVDNSPSAMILPTSFFDFFQEANDFCFPPLIGSYLRIVRTLTLIASLLITPLWYLVVRNPDSLPSFLSFVAIQEPNEVPLLVQLLLVEFTVDLLKLASLNTPDVLSNSFSMLGALILGDFAVQAHWLVGEVLVYMAFVAIASFAQPSFELGYAIKLSRMALLIFCAAIGWWGMAAGIIMILVMLCTTKPIVGKGYLSPLIPFDGAALLHKFFRRPISRKNT